MVLYFVQPASTGAGVQDRRLPMQGIRHENLDHGLQPQHELHLLPWPFLVGPFAVLVLVVFFVVAN